MSQASGPVTSFDKPLMSFEMIDGLVAEISKACDRPVNILQIAALLESAGVNDAIARSRYSQKDVFVLAKQVADRITEFTEIDADTLKPETIPPDHWTTTLIHYMRGPLSILPLLLLTLIIHIYQNYSQWGNAQILTLSAATIGSLLVTSGFVQVASRKGSIYLSQGYVRAAERFLIGVYIASGIVIFTSAVALAIAGRLLGLLTPSDQFLLLVAYITLSILWLFSATLSMLEQVHWFGISLAFGVGISYLSLRGLTALDLSLNWVLLIATLAGILVTMCLLIYRILRTFKQKTEETPHSQYRVAFAPLLQMILNLSPYFGYGLLYVLMILAGHVGGWVGRVPTGLSRMGALVSSESGLTIALGGFILASGVAERTMHRFWHRVNSYLRGTRSDKPELFNTVIGDFRRSERRNFTFTLLISTIIVVVMTVALVQFVTPGMLLGIRWSGSILTVLIFGLIGYGFLAMGIFESMFLITLSRPLYALKALGAGTVATLIGSLGVGLLIDYSYGAIGIVFGSFLFMVMARRQVDYVIDHAGYFYYASF